MWPIVIVVFTIRVLSIAVVLFIVVFMNTKMSLSFIYSLILWILYLSLYLFTLFLIVIFNFKHTFRGEWFECTTCTGLMLAHNTVKMGLHVKILKNEFVKTTKSEPITICDCCCITTKIWMPRFSKKKNNDTTLKMEELVDHNSIDQANV